MSGNLGPPRPSVALLRAATLALLQLNVATNPDHAPEDEPENESEHESEQQSEQLPDNESEEVEQYAQ
jgi:hypothetical protein